ncbi:hypothetical protein Trisim1_000010 [Trichoderma cf. simile WF8]
MASAQPIPSATEIRDADPSSAPLPAIPRRVQELKEGQPKEGPRKRLKARARRGSSRRWREQIVSDLRDDESFNNHIAILKIIRSIPELRDHAPQLASNNPVTRSYTIKYPPRDLIPFEKEARFMHLSYREIQGIKSQLYRSVKILYNNGVGYNIYPHHLYLYGSRSWDLTPLLFLGSVTSSDILDIGQLDWKEQRAHVCDQIDRVFAPLEIWTFQKEAADLAKHARAEMDRATSIINEKNAAIDSAKADLTEAQAIMAEAFQMIKNARATLEGVNVTTKEIYSSVVDPQCAWDRAQLKKENANTKLKQTDALTDRANTLLQKYGIPKLNHGVDAEDAISNSDIKPEDNAEMKNDSPAIDAKVTNECTAQDEASTDQINSTEEGRFGT